MGRKRKGGANTICGTGACMERNVVAHDIRREIKKKKKKKEYRSVTFARAFDDCSARPRSFTNLSAVYPV